MKRQLAFFITVSVGLVFLYVFIEFSTPVNPSKGPEEVQIPHGMNFRQAADLLKSKGYINDSRLFVLAARLTGADRRLKPGYYVVSGSMSPWTVFTLLKDSKLLQNEVTIVEGDSLMEIRQKLAGEKIMSGEDFDSLATSSRFLAKMNIDAPSLEGYLFPDTYTFPKGEPPEQVFEMMISRLRQEYGGKLEARTRAMGLSLNTVLTLASIVEKEAVKDAERPIIAAVFFNRLKMGMPLQSDPTAVYGWKPFCEGVTSGDLKRCTKYNTYKIRGLPPGPIDCPGIKSIKAVLYPAKVDYLYFVSNYDGTHTFSETYDEQKEAILHARAELQEKQAEEGTVDETAKGN